MHKCIKYNEVAVYAAEIITVPSEVFIMIEKKQYRFAIIGGDKRQMIVAGEIQRLGHNVSCVGFEDGDSLLSGCEVCSSVDKAMRDADFALLPLPITRDGVNVSSLCGENIALSDVLKLAKKNRTLLLGGVVTYDFSCQCSDFGVEIIDYYKSESLQTKNALPSAEGALMIAMEHTEITLHGMKALITGFGRIGKILSEMLKRLGASVTVAARRDETLCEITMSGFRAVRSDADGLSYAADCDVIFNTVPSIIFTEKVLQSYKNRPLYVEIASAPGGIDGSAARNMGVKIINAPSLPGKYSPVSAGKYLFETVFEILSERGIIL